MPVLVLPAEQLIRDLDAFAKAVEAALATAREGLLVTFGISPTHPETGFGYVECGEALAVAVGSPPIHRVARFVEKPAIATAQAYVASGRFVWNSGM
ncbi:MAG: sugar phosphate nucleotidyltransferase, partial [bacterium]